MISIEWQNQGTCENCGKDNPHCAKVHIEKLRLPKVRAKAKDVLEILLCSDCIEDLKKRLS